VTLEIGFALEVGIIWGVGFLNVGPAFKNPTL
jgi:hypothetical protein